MCSVSRRRLRRAAGGWLLCRLRLGQSSLDRQYKRAKALYMAQRRLDGIEYGLHAIGRHMHEKPGQGAREFMPRLHALGATDQLAQALGLFARNHDLDQPFGHARCQPTGCRTQYHALPPPPQRSAPASSRGPLLQQ